MPQNTITVRNYHPGDFEAVKSLLQKTKLYDELTDAPIRYQNKITQNPDSVKIAWGEQGVIGVLVIINEWGPTIARLAVDPQAQQKGLGTTLLETAEEMLRQKYHRQVTIQVPQNDRNLQQYLKNRGYRIDQNLTQFSKDL